MTSALEEYEILPVDDVDGFREFYEIYVEALPARERKSEQQMKRLLSRPDYFLLVCRSGGRVIGFSVVFQSESAGFCLLEYMAVSKECRNAGSGSRLFDYSREWADRRVSGAPLLLEVDSERENSADRPLRLRRKRFYRRLGCFQIDGLHYLLPLRGTGPVPEMDLMVHFRQTPTPLAKARLQVWLETLFVEVYDRERSDPNIATMMSQVGDPVELK